MDTYPVVMRGHFIDLDLKMTDQHADDRAQLDIRKLLADATMPSSTKRLIHALGTLRDSAKPIVDLLACGVLVHVKRLLRDTLGVGPAGRLPVSRGLPYARVHLRDDGRGKHEVAFGYDVGACVVGLRGLAAGGGECGRNWDVGLDVPLQNKERDVRVNVH